MTTKTSPTSPISKAEANIRRRIEEEPSIAAPRIG